MNDIKCSKQTASLGAEVLAWSVGARPLVTWSFGTSKEALMAVTLGALVLAGGTGFAELLLGRSFGLVPVADEEADDSKHKIAILLKFWY